MYARSRFYAFRPKQRREKLLYVCECRSVFTCSVGNTDASQWDEEQVAFAQNERSNKEIRKTRNFDAKELFIVFCW